MVAESMPVCCHIFLHPTQPRTHGRSTGWGTAQLGSTLADLSNSFSESGLKQFRQHVQIRTAISAHNSFRFPPCLFSADSCGARGQNTTHIFSCGVFCSGVNTLPYENEPWLIFVRASHALHQLLNQAGWLSWFIYLHQQSYEINKNMITLKTDKH